MLRYWEHENWRPRQSELMLKKLKRHREGTERKAIQCPRQSVVGDPEHSVQKKDHRR